MNNQKVTKLSAKDHEIATLKKGNNYLLERVKQQAADITERERELKQQAADLSKFHDKLYEKDNERDLIGGKYYKMAVELDKIKSHWLYKLINWFK